MSQVSVIIPAYNRMNYLPETLESLLNQTFKDFRDFPFFSSFFLTSNLG